MAGKPELALTLKFTATRPVRCQIRSLRNGRCRFADRKPAQCGSTGTSPTKGGSQNDFVSSEEFDTRKNSNAPT